MENKINELMGLVDSHSEALVNIVKAITLQDLAIANSEATDSYNAIETKLRELLTEQSRKPLTADQISASFITEADAAIDDCVSYIAGVRYAERAHGITDKN